MTRRHKHNLSATEVNTFDPGEFIPIGLNEIVPGDSIQHKTSAVIRCLPLLAPIMHEVEVLITHSYVPYRLIWEDWEDFITGGDDGLNASTFPTIDFSGSPVAKGDLAHYLGLPVGFNTTASALPFRAYALFWNDHIRDEELQTELTIDQTSGADTTTSTTLKNVNWARERLTGANANEQLGTSIGLPLGTAAPIKTDATTTADLSILNASDNYVKMDVASGSYLFKQDGVAGTSGNRLYGDLTNASAATINELREAIALQKFAEMRQIYGSTYEKLIEHDFGVTPQDGRLQNSEIISRGRGVVNFSEVLATAETGSTVDVGDMKGHGIAAVRSNKYRKFFPEYGYLLSFVAVRPKPSYTQGVDKHWLKNAKEDFYSPHLEHMGMQAITNREVKYDHSTPGGTFGYEPRYNEYRKNYNKYKGELTDTLDHWHMGRELTGDPALNSSFITCSPTNRVFAQSATDNLIGMFRHSIQARRLVKKSVKPVGLI
jgi:hypothetical protein